MASKALKLIDKLDISITKGIEGICSHCIANQLRQSCIKCEDLVKKFAASKYADQALRDADYLLQTLADSMDVAQQKVLGIYREPKLKVEEQRFKSEPLFPDELESKLHAIQPIENLSFVDSNVCRKESQIKVQRSITDNYIDTSGRFITDQESADQGKQKPTLTLLERLHKMKDEDVNDLMEGIIKALKKGDMELIKNLSKTKRGKQRLSISETNKDLEELIIQAIMSDENESNELALHMLDLIKAQGEYNDFVTKIKIKLHKDLISVGKQIDISDIKDALKTEDEMGEEGLLLRSPGLLSLVRKKVKAYKNILLLKTKNRLTELMKSDPEVSVITEIITPKLIDTNMTKKIEAIVLQNIKQKKIKISNENEEKELNIATESEETLPSAFGSLEKFTFEKALHEGAKFKKKAQHIAKLIRKKSVKPTEIYAINSQLNTHKQVTQEIVSLIRRKTKLFSPSELSPHLKQKKIAEGQKHLIDQGVKERIATGHKLKGKTDHLKKEKGTRTKYILPPGNLSDDRNLTKMQGEKQAEKFFFPLEKERILDVKKICLKNVGTMEEERKSIASLKFITKKESLKISKEEKTSTPLIGKEKLEQTGNIEPFLLKGSKKSTDGATDEEIEATGSDIMLSRYRGETKIKKKRDQTKKSVKERIKKTSQETDENKSKEKDEIHSVLKEDTDQTISNLSNLRKRNEIKMDVKERNKKKEHKEKDEDDLNFSITKIRSDQTKKSIKERDKNTQESDKEDESDPKKKYEDFDQTPSDLNVPDIKKRRNKIKTDIKERNKKAPQEKYETKNKEYKEKEKLDLNLSNTKKIIDQTKKGVKERDKNTPQESDTEEENAPKEKDEVDRADRLDSDQASNDLSLWDTSLMRGRGEHKIKKRRGQTNQVVQEMEPQPQETDEKKVNEPKNEDEADKAFKLDTNQAPSNLNLSHISLKRDLGETIKNKRRDKTKQDVEEYNKKKQQRTDENKENESKEKDEDERDTIASKLNKILKKQDQSGAKTLKRAKKIKEKSDIDRKKAEKLLSEQTVSAVKLPDIKRPTSSSKKRHSANHKNIEVDINSIKIRPVSQDNLIVKLVQAYQSKKPKKVIDAAKSDELLKKMAARAKTKRKIREVSAEPSPSTSTESSIEQKKSESFKKIIGGKILTHTRPHSEKSLFKKTKERKPIIFHTPFDAQLQKISEPVMFPTKTKLALGMEQENEAVGCFRYQLSDASNIENGYTQLPILKHVRKVNLYRMRPANPEFDWFEHNKNKKFLQYNTGELLADITNDGRGRWYYRNGGIALEYYDAEDTRAKQRIIIYSTSEPDQPGQAQDVTILAAFDYSGNGIIFDENGHVRLEYNQTEGVLLDRKIGPETHWQWHDLNDPPEYENVMVETREKPKELRLEEFDDFSNYNSPTVGVEDEHMAAIEFENKIKERAAKTKHSILKYKPFPIRMKAIKLNNFFSVKIFDQTKVYIIYRDCPTSMKINVGMILDPNEILETGNFELKRALNTHSHSCLTVTESIDNLQNILEAARRRERKRLWLKRKLYPVDPSAEEDRHKAALSLPLRLNLYQLKLKHIPDHSNNQCPCNL